MTSLLGRLLPLFVGSQRVEDLFTEAVARLFERRPEICLAWLDELGFIAPTSEEERRHISVSTQKSFVALEEHDGMGSRPDLILEVYHTAGDEESESSKDVVMIESKLGSWEGQEQLKRYAEHLERILVDRKILVYITRAYDPKEPEEILTGTHNVEFRQLRWHDFYRFLQTAEKDTLTEEVMLFMEEQGMSRSHRLSTSDLMALSSVPRAFEIMDETLDGEVRTELGFFAGHKTKGEMHGLYQIRNLGRHVISAPLYERDLGCFLGYRMYNSDGYPAAIIHLEVRPRAVRREVSVAAMKKIAFREGWKSYNLNDPTAWFGVSCAKSLATFLPEEDHIAAIKHFFIESIRELREELTEFKKENPDLPWNGGS